MRLIFFMHLFFVSAFTLPQSIAAEKIELIQLQNIVAEDIIPVIKPLIGSDAVITGKGYQLIARTTPSNLEKIKTIVKQIDVPQRMLRITLREGKRSLERGRSIAADGTIALSTDTAIVLGENSETHFDRLRIRTKNHTTEGRDDILYEVRTVENRATFLRLGKSVPYEVAAMGNDGETHGLRTQHRTQRVIQRCFRGP